MNRRETLQAAENAVLRDREADHGRPEDTFATIAAMWSAMLGQNISPANVAMMLAALKIARATSNPAHEDNYVDLAGYAACAAELAT